MYRRGSLTLLAGLVATVWFAAPGSAQIVERGNFDLNIGGGAILHPNHSALVSVSPMLSLQGRAFITENLGIGFALDYTRTETDDDIFPLAQFQFPAVDSTTLVALRQPVALFHYQIIGSFGFATGDNLYPYLLAGIGGYTVYLDPQQNNAPTRQSDLALSIGGAVKLRVGGSSSIELSVRDVIYTGFDRDEMNPQLDRTCRESGFKQFSGEVCPNERFPLLNPEFADPNWSEAKSTVHNIAFSASFSFVPGL